MSKLDGSLNEKIYTKDFSQKRHIFIFKLPLLN
jgi:hypothetical protein